MALRNFSRFLVFAAGLVAGAGGLYLSVHARVIPIVLADVDAQPSPTPSTAAKPRVVEIRVADDDLRALLRRQLILPIGGFDPALLHDTFSTPRPGHQAHEAIDIPARRGTPIHAADDGVIALLAVTRRAGISIYQLDPSGVYCYFYAHLDRYVNHRRAGRRVKRGDVIGFVGSTRDARTSGPHLHFSITRVISGWRWWDGAPINPYPVFAGISCNDSDPDN